MKNKIIGIILISTILFGCGSSTQETQTQTIPEKKIKTYVLPVDPYTLSSSEYAIVVIDSCEYIVGWGGGGNGGAFMTHKGNCKNHKHASN
jgi:hypothetical protein